MSFFERYLTVWVFLAICMGVFLGNFLPGVFTAIAAMEVAHVNLVVAVLIWVMIFPMMVQIDFSAIRQIRKEPQGVVLTCAVNWLVKPFTMAGIAWLFFRVLFASLVEPGTADFYIAGMILLGVAPCTAMVFVWSQLTKGDPNYTLVQVAVNDVIMVFAFAPVASFLIGVSGISVPWITMLLSVCLYVVIPLLGGIYLRNRLDRKNDHARLNIFLATMKPWSVCGLLLTVVLLFGLQAKTILASPLVILLIAIPLLIQTYGIFFITLGIAWQQRLSHRIVAPACLIATSNFFELAVAVAISLFGLESGASMATVVGVLVEVPVMLSLVALSNRLRPAIKARYKEARGRAPGLEPVKS